MGSRHGNVERQLERLDRSSGLLLTLRSRHTARLTSAGSRMLAAGHRFFRQVDLAVRTQIFGRGSEAVSSPRILAISSTEPLLEDVIEDAAATLGVLLSVSHEAPHQVLRHLAGYRVDAGHTWTLEAPGDTLDRPVRECRVLDDPLWVTLPRDHPMAARETVSLADLLEESWVSESGPASEVVVARVFGSTGLPVPARLQVTSASVARGILRRGDAIGFGSPACPAVLSPSLVRRSVLERPHRSSTLLVDPTVVPRPLAEQLAALLTRHCLNRFADQYPDLLRDRWWAEWYRERRERLSSDPVPSRCAEAGSVAAGPAENGTLDVEDLRLLRAVAEHGSINRAATVLSISQSALTRRIHRLELRLGARLLLRSSRGTDLTSPARQFLRQLTKFEAEFHDAEAACGSVSHARPESRWDAYGSARHAQGSGRAS
ncbi:LysR family transcriptional regulator [Streptomyces sp. NPDC058231]|uniref:LysR family transcriptional regulator n=1 Tax=Streptomyces sp. NPDC058231 TaxID=3346392 RepID=UPI0036E56F79